MSVRAITRYVTDLLNGTTVAGFQPLDVRDELPVQDRAGDAPKLFVWPLDGTKKRETGPRGQGFKLAEHRLAINVILAMRTPEPNSADPSFRDLLEAICDVLEKSPIMASVTDARTGAESTVRGLGEELSYHYEPPTLVSGQRQPIFTGEVEATLAEVYRG